MAPVRAQDANREAQDRKLALTEIGPNKRYAISRDIIVIAFRQPDAIHDPLTELAREGAPRILAQVLIAEADAFVALWKDLKLPDGRDRVVRHGHGPLRAIETGIGPVEVRRAKVRDRGDVGPEAKIRFTSSIPPKALGVADLNISANRGEARTGR